MTSLDLSRLAPEKLNDLLARAHAEMASRESQRRKDMRTELEGLVEAEGYKLADIFPQIGGSTDKPPRQKRPAKYRNPQNPEQSWSGIGRTPKWVQAILDERGIDMAAFKSIPMYRILGT